MDYFNSIRQIFKPANFYSLSTVAYRKFKQKKKIDRRVHTQDPDDLFTASQ